MIKSGTSNARELQISTKLLCVSAVLCVLRETSFAANTQRKDAKIRKDAKNRHAGFFLLGFHCDSIGLDRALPGGLAEWD